MFMSYRSVFNADGMKSLRENQEEDLNSPVEEEWLREFAGRSSALMTR